jgi:hypothetical protein
MKGFQPSSSQYSENLWPGLKRASPLMISWDIQGENWIETRTGSHLVSDTRATLVPTETKGFGKSQQR